MTIRRLDSFGIAPLQGPNGFDDRVDAGALPFPVRLTAMTEGGTYLGAGLWVYDWVELDVDPGTGLLVDMVGGRVGTYSLGGIGNQPALELNNISLESLGAFNVVWMRSRGLFQGQQIFEFAAPSSIQGGGDITGAPLPPLPGVLDTFPKWFKLRWTAAEIGQLAGLATSVIIPVVTQPCAVHWVVIKPAQEFVLGGLGYALSVGYKDATFFYATMNLQQVPGPDIRQEKTGATPTPDMEPFYQGAVGNADKQVSLIVTGDTVSPLNSATQGEVDIWLLLSQPELPT